MNTHGTASAPLMISFKLEKLESLHMLRDGSVIFNLSHGEDEVKGDG